MKLLFGPVNSRRLGFSMGLDLVPKKICSMDCLYCEVGITTELTLIRKEYIPWEEIEKTLYEAKEKEETFDVLTLTGSGEPTLNLNFEKTLNLAKSLIQKPVAVLTNSSTLYIESIRLALAQADIVLASLDSATEKGFRLINRPVKGLKISSILEGLKKLREIMKGELWLEILFVKGYNDSQEELLALKRAIEEIKPHKLQLNTVTRPPAYPIAKPLEREELERIKEFLGQGVEILLPKEKERKNTFTEDLSEEILNYLVRRPAPFSELETVFGDRERIQKVLQELLRLGKIKEIVYKGQIFYLL